MKIEIQKQKKSEMKILVELTKDEMTKYEDLAATEISQDVKIDGFRVGKAPISIIRSRVGDTAFEAHAADLALQETYVKAIMDNKIDVVAHPKINIISQSPLKYEATVAIVPEINLKDYSGVSIKSKEVKITDKDVENVMDSLIKRSATYKDVERVCKNGDRVEIDFAGFDKEGKPLSGTSSKNHPIVLGDGMMIPGFEDGIVGMKKDEKRRLKIKFPKKYHAEEYQGKDVEFDITVKRIEERELPKMDDAFAEKVSGGNAKTVEKLKEEIKKNLEDVRKEDEERRREDEFLRKLIELSELEIPEAMIEHEIDAMLDKSRRDMGIKEEDFAKFVTAQKEKGKDPRKDLEGKAKEQITLRLALKEVLNREKIEISKDEIQKELEGLLKTYPDKYKDEIKKAYAEGTDAYKMLESELKLKKLFKKYLK